MITATNIERAKAIAAFANHAGAAGLPLDTQLVVHVSGSVSSARNTLDDVARILTEIRMPFDREVTARRQAVIVPIGAGCTYRVVHTILEPAQPAEVFA